MCDGRLEQPTVNGRDRVNINRLLNVHDVTDVIAHESESVNAESTKNVYQSALKRHPEASVIYIISDNAHYYHNKKLKEWVDGTKIRQILRAEPLFDWEALEIQTGCQGFLRQYRKI